MQVFSDINIFGNNIKVILQQISVALPGFSKEELNMKYKISETKPEMSWLLITSMDQAPNH